ncbi:hypothetical protein EAI_01141 [Harpegnathos saltator]|uniref:Odorant receptor 13a n=1 Tax=Harpegnathos saltator TaxID=610380 RepID=E2BAY3_HARSA|nr:hypothetical protein EAI_01141 [Harpegnathos saltator]
MKEERDVMLRHARIIRAIAMCGMFGAVFAIIVISGFPSLGLQLRQVTNLTDSGKPLPIPSYYLHDVSKSPQYELSFLAQVFAMIACGCFYTAIDHFLGLLVLHVCGQLENLYLRLSRMEKYSNINAALEYNVQDHVRIIRSVEIIDVTFNWMLLILVLYFGVLFCLQAFLIVKVSKK